MLEPQKPTVHHITEELQRAELRRNGLNRKWATYGSGAEQYFGRSTSDSFGGLITIDMIKERFEKISERTGKKIAVFEVFGQGRAGLELGADLSISWTLTDERVLDPDKHRAYTGNIFEVQKCDEVFKEWDEKFEPEFAMGLVISRPMGAMQEYGPSNEAFEIWAEHIFSGLYRRTPPGGILALEFSEAPAARFAEFTLFLENKGIAFHRDHLHQVIVIDKPE